MIKKLILAGWCVLNLLSQTMAFILLEVTVRCVLLRQTLSCKEGHKVVFCSLSDRKLGNFVEKN